MARRQVGLGSGMLPVVTGYSPISPPQIVVRKEPEPCFACAGSRLECRCGGLREHPLAPVARSGSRSDIPR